MFLGALTLDKFLIGPWFGDGDWDCSWWARACLKWFVKMNSLILTKLDVLHSKVELKMAAIASAPPEHNSGA